MTTTVSAGSMSATSNATIVDKDDARAISLPLLVQLAKLAEKKADATSANPRTVDCRHPDCDARAVFCGRCGALLVSVSDAIQTLAKMFGAAFALQQVLCGDAVAHAQRVHKATRKAVAA